MSNMDKLAKELKTMMAASDDRKPKPYDTQAEVLRVEDGVAWVHIPGGVQETPVRLTMNAKKGDMVNVRVASGSAWITGNGTNPPTDDTTANIANETASKAMSIGEMAMSDAERARVAADSAEAEANRARETAEGVETIATRAERSAGDAQKAADSAAQSADTAFSQLSIVENVVGVLKLVSEHGQYDLTEDDEVIPDKWYFTRSGTAPNYVYEVVSDPSGDPSAQGWYELTGIKEAIQNYVSNQLVVDGQGLWLRRPEGTGIGTKVLLSSEDGVVLYGPNGDVVGKYGATAQIGDGSSFHISLSGTRLGFWKGTEQDANNEIAYISGQQLYITKSVVLQQMDLGEPEPIGLGQWSWKIHPNGQNPLRNNLYLKWNG